MAYTNSVPQANQTIASTTTPINNNFIFLQTGIGYDHNFNASGTGSDMYHNQCSMPNRGNPSSLPAGIDGMYYSRNGTPRYYNGSINYIQTSLVTFEMLEGTVSLSTSSHSVTAFPANSAGAYYLIPPSGISAAAYAVGQWVTGSGTLQVSGFDPNISLSTSGLTLYAETTSSSYNGTYTYIVTCFTP